MKVICFYLQSHTLALDFTRDPLIGLRCLQADCKVTNCTSLFRVNQNLFFFFHIYQLQNWLQDENSHRVILILALYHYVNKNYSTLLCWLPNKTFFASAGFTGTHLGLGSEFSFLSLRLFQGATYCDQLLERDGKNPAGHRIPYVTGITYLVHFRRKSRRD